MSEKAKLIVTVLLLIVAILDIETLGLPAIVSAGYIWGYAPTTK